MITIDPYLFFAGNCSSVISFYEKALGAEVLSLQKFGEGPVEVPAEAKDLVMHAALRIGGSVIMFSDSMPGQDSVAGNNFSLSINCNSTEEQDQYYKALAEGGQEIMPLEETFWGARFGMLVDQFGISWMFSYHGEEPTES